MRRFVNLGSADMSGIYTLTKFNLSRIPIAKNYHLGNILFRLDITGTATAPVSRAMFLQGLIQKFSLYMNNRVIVDNMNGQTLHWVYQRIGSNNFVEWIPYISNIGQYSVSYFFSVPFKNNILLSPYDFCPSVSDIENIEYEIQLGSIDDIGSTPTINCRVYAEIFERENEYYVPYFRMRQFTITKEISDIIQIPNRTLFWVMFLPSSGTYNDTIILRSRNSSIVENQKMYDVLFSLNPPFSFDPVQDSDYSYLPFAVFPDRPLSVKKPMLFENEQLFYDDMDTSNTPFQFFVYEIFPNEALGGESEIDSRYSPKKK